MRIKLFMLSACFLFAVSAQATNLYTYTFTFNADNSSDIQGFSFSVGTDTLFAPNDTITPPAGTTVTSGTSTWTLTQGALFTQGSALNFEFATSDVISIYAGGDNVNVDPHGFVNFIFFNAIPEVGTFTFDQVAADFTDALGNSLNLVTATDENGNPTSSLTITGGAPEPSTWALFGGAALLAVANRRRLLQR